MSLYERFLFYRKQGNTLSRRRHCKILQLWPLYYPSEAGDEDNEDNEQWCRARLLLHHPHRRTAELRGEDESWQQAYTRCVAQHPQGHKDTLPTRPRRQREANPHTDSDTEWSTGDEEERQYDDWQVMAAMGPEQDLDWWTGPAFGTRDIDVQYDWQQKSREWGMDGLMERVEYIGIEKKQVSWSSMSFRLYGSASYKPRLSHRQIGSASTSPF